MSQEKVLRFIIPLIETFSNLISFTLINKYDKRAVVKISTVSGTAYHFAYRRVF